MSWTAVKTFCRTTVTVLEVVILSGVPSNTQVNRLVGA